MAKHTNRFTIGTNGHGVVTNTGMVRIGTPLVWDNPAVAVKWCRAYNVSTEHRLFMFQNGKLLWEVFL